MCDKTLRADWTHDKASAVAPIEDNIMARATLLRRILTKCYVMYTPRIM